MIWAACKDPGGLNQVLPVVQELRKRGHQVLVISNGQAVEALRSQHESYIFAELWDQLSSYKLEEPSLFFTSLCGGGIGQDIIANLKPFRTFSTVALQDFWGAWIFTDWGKSQIKPDFVCVNDETDAQLILKAWPEHQKNQVKITGYPNFDKYSTFKTGEIRASVRSKLDLDPVKPIILFAGQLWYTKDALAEMVEALNELKLDIYFVPRFHPRMQREMPEDAQKCSEILEQFSGETLIKDTSVFDSPTILGAADIVTGMFTTMLIEAAVLRKPNISILYPETGMKQFLSECPGIDEFTLVSAGCTYKATNRNELKNAIVKSMAVDEKLRSAQEHNFQLDGLNTTRIADFLESLI